MESVFQLERLDCGLTVAVADYGIEILVYFLLMLMIFTAAMDSSMTASMLAFATSVDSIPLPEFVSLDVKYVCVYCHRALNIPRQLPCGHRICKLCVDKLFTDAVNQFRVRCPSGDVECDTDITAEQVIRRLYAVVSDLCCTVH